MNRRQAPASAMISLGRLIKYENLAFQIRFS
jgi:hypothetical protein